MLSEYWELVSKHSPTDEVQVPATARRSITDKDAYFDKTFILKVFTSPAPTHSQFSINLVKLTMTTIGRLHSYIPHELCL